jgi:2-amino-4-hydroxy-6-hydroxymethyldihydropteridine diphosphokinase
MIAYVGIGANLGDARANVADALARLARLPQTTLLRASSLYRTAPIDSSGDDYINAVACLETMLDAHALLAALLGIEQAHGRERPYRNAPRTLDLDLLRHGDTTMHSAALTLPHPRIGERAFVLLPLAEIAPALVTPEQLARVADQRIEKLRAGLDGLAH